MLSKHLGALTASVHRAEAEPCAAGRCEQADRLSLRSRFLIYLSVPIGGQHRGKASFPGPQHSVTICSVSSTLRTPT